MKINVHAHFHSVALLVVLDFCGDDARSRRAAPGDFTSVDYFDAPHQQQMKTRLSGAEAQPVPGGLLRSNSSSWKFQHERQPATVVEAPECIYDTQNGMANSPGHLQMRRATENSGSRATVFCGGRTIPSSPSRTMSTR